MDLPGHLEDWWADYRASLRRRDRSDATAEVYRQSYEQFWTWAVGDGIDHPEKVDASVLNRWVDAMHQATATRGGRPIYVVDPHTGERVPKLLDPSTRRIRWQNLRPFFSWWSREVDSPSPFDRADPPGEGRKEPVPVIEQDDVKRILATCTTKDFADVRDDAIIRVLYSTGARLGELVNLKVADFDRRNDLLTLDGKTGIRVVPVPGVTRDALARYVRDVRPKHQHAGIQAMWLGSKGALTPSGVAQLLRRRCDLAGVPHMNPHRFRHSWAHEFRVQEGSEGDLMYLAGWKSTAMAHRYGQSAAAQRAQETGRRIGVGDNL